MRQQSIIPRILGIIAVFVLLNVTPIQSQQKISIKDGNTPVGHFFVEILHNMPGAPMKSFLGNGGTISVTESSNNFILRMQNFVWYEPDEEIILSFNSDRINVQSNCQLALDPGKVITLKPLRNYIRDIRFSVQGNGTVKLSIPFDYQGKEGRFLQDFTINLQQGDTQEVSVKEVPKLKSSDVRKIWNKIDRKDPKALGSFIAMYKNEKAASSYVKKATKSLEKIIDEDAKNKFEASKVAKTSSEKKEIEKTSDPDVKDPEKADVQELSEEAVLEDIQAVIDTLNLNESNDDLITSIDESDLYLVLNDNDIQKVNLNHSQMPLQIQFYELGQTEGNLINRIPIPFFQLDTTIRIDKDLLKSNKLKGEFSKIDLFDINGEKIFNGIIDLNTQKGGGSNALVYIIGLSLLLLGFGLFVIFSRLKKEKKRQQTKKAFAAKINENQEKQEEIAKGTLATHEEAPRTAISGNKIKIGAKNKIPEVKAPSHSIARKSNGTSRIKITKRKTSGIPIPSSELMALKAEYKTVDINLNAIWDDSIIDKVYLAPEFIQSLDNFLADSSNDGIQNELQGAIPEVGGFMMGRFSKDKDHIQVLVEKFVPFVPEYNDVFKIEIGTKTLVDELGDAQDKNPKMEVIGWFHTHPGHGLFLSTSDLSVQRHFPNDYQVAMEIDSLTKGLDMSVFSRKFSGRMNNSNDRKAGTNWFQWVDIDNSNVN